MFKEVIKMKELKLEVKKLERRDTKQIPCLSAICGGKSCTAGMLEGFGALFVGCGSIIDGCTPCALELFETIKLDICCE
jgi:hypothetical protein